MKVTMRQSDSVDSLNWISILVWIAASSRLHLPLWIALGLGVLLFSLINYRIGSPTAPPKVLTKPSPYRALLHPASWMLAALALYAIWVFTHWGWLFWFVVFGSAVGAFVATFLRSKARA